MPPDKIEYSKLALGWEMDEELQPIYWLSGNAKAGEQNDTDLVFAPSEKIAAHTAIIAQSGSGKSFFLGRLIEEILTKTKCRCIIFDPNADFRRVGEVVDKSLWEKANLKEGKLPHEEKREDFMALWEKVKIQIYINSSKKKEFQHKFRIWWPDISIETICDGVGPVLMNELFHCHQFVIALSQLYLLKSLNSDNSYDVLNKCEEHSKLIELGRPEIRKRLEAEFADLNRLKPKDLSFWQIIRIVHLFSGKKDLIISHLDQALHSLEYVSQNALKYYFGKASEFKSSGILLNTTQELIQDQIVNYNAFDLKVLDLPSLADKNTRLLAISSIINQEWSRVRAEWEQALKNDLEKDIKKESKKESKKGDERVPTFIIIDEAHNLVPADVETVAQAAVRDSLRTIIAEGRKYGLFLIVVSQRPDKLDPLIVSECTNKAVMKISSPAVLEITKKMLGLEDLEEGLKISLKFPIGRVLIVGPWAGKEPRYLYSAARRTVEGGGNLSEKYWATTKK